MDDDGMPSEFDVVVIGTGLSESILAGALCRIGQRVLHLDDRDFYGGNQATFNLQDFHNLGDQQSNDNDNENDDDGHRDVDVSKVASMIPDTDRFVAANYSLNELQDIESTIFVPEDEVVHAKKSETKSEPENDSEWLANLGRLFEKIELEADDDDEEDGVEDVDGDVNARTPPVVSNVESWKAMLKQSRKYSIDVTPKACFSRGKLVKLLISANIGRYLEFKVVGDTFIHTKSTIREVPCSKQTLLLNRTVTPREKRQLMKFLQFCSQPPPPPPPQTVEAAATTADETSQQQQQQRQPPPPPPSSHEPEAGVCFGEYLTEKWKFSEDSASFIMYAIAGKTPKDTAVEGIAAVQRYFMSIGGYGKTPFIYPLYGTGEIPQAFCRLAAVFGGIYILRQKIDGFTLSKETSKCTGIVMNGKHIKSKWIVTSSRCTPASCAEATRTRVSRAVLITDANIVANNTEPTLLLCVPPSTTSNPHNVNVLCLSSQAVACPHGKWLVQLTSPAVNTAKSDLEGVTKLLTRDPEETDNDKATPTLLFSKYFTSTSATHDSLKLADGTELENLLMIRSRGSADLHFEDIVTEAEETFRKICAEEEFLPPAPNPEDVVWETAGDDNEGSADDAEEIRLATLEISSDAILSDVTELRQQFDRIQHRIEQLSS